MSNATIFTLHGRKFCFSSAAAFPFPTTEDSYSSSLCCPWHFLFLSHNQRASKLAPRVCKRVVCSLRGTDRRVQSRDGKHSKKNWKPESFGHRKVNKKMKPCKKSEEKERLFNCEFSHPSEDCLSRLFDEQPFRLHNSFPTFQCIPQELDMHTQDFPRLSMRAFMEHSNGASQANDFDRDANWKPEFSTRLLNILSSFATRKEDLYEAPVDTKLQSVKGNFGEVKFEMSPQNEALTDCQPQIKPAIGTEKLECEVGDMAEGIAGLVLCKNGLEYDPHLISSDKDSLGCSIDKDVSQSELTFFEETDWNSDSSDEDWHSDESKPGKQKGEIVVSDCSSHPPDIQQALQPEPSSLCSRVIIPPRHLSMSLGSRSSPSRSSIPGLHSKYSKPDRKAKQLETHEKPLCILPKFELMTEVNEDNVTSEDILKNLNSEEKELEFDWLESDDDDIMESHSNGVVKSRSCEMEIPLKVPLRSDVDTCLQNKSFLEVRNGGISNGSRNSSKQTVENCGENTESVLADAEVTVHATTEDIAWSNSNTDRILEEAKSMPRQIKSLRSSKIKTKNSGAPVIAQHFFLSQKHWQVMRSNKLYKAKDMPIQPSSWYNREEYEKRGFSSCTEPKPLHQLPATVNFVDVPPWKTLEYPNVPFQFEYSYSEIPKSPILGFRDHLSPFAPVTMRRPWTGCPLTKPRMIVNQSFDPVRQRIRSFEFSFNRKGVPTEKMKSRKEILGKPLTINEVVQLVRDCHREKRQVNLGRDGLTHNMLHLIHNHWKCRPVCRIKCRGPPTIDMDNVCFHVEDKTGGQIIYRTGCVLYVFRGRHYSYRYRPLLPLMLYRPSSAVYPKLVPQAPEGLTIEQAHKLRILGQKVQPLTKLRRHGAFPDLVEDVRKAFMLDDLVSLDYGDLKPADFRKIGAKLMELVPCVLLSFRNHRIVLWKGRNATSCSLQSSPLNAEEISIALESVRDGISAECSSASAPEFKLEDSPSEALPGMTATGCSPKLVNTPASSQNLESHSGLQHRRDYDVICSSNLVDDIQENFEEFDAARDLDIPNQAIETSLVHGRLEGLWDSALKKGVAAQLEDVDLEADLVLQIATVFSEVAPQGPKFVGSSPYVSPFQGVYQKCEKPFVVQIRQKRDTLRKRDRRRASLSAKVKRRPDTGYPLDALTRILTEH